MKGLIKKKRQMLILQNTRYTETQYSRLESLGIVSAPASRTTDVGLVADCVSKRVLQEQASVDKDKAKVTLSLSLSLSSVDPTGTLHDPDTVGNVFKLIVSVLVKVQSERTVELLKNNSLSSRSLHKYF